MTAGGPPPSRYASLDRDQLARLLPELLLIGHLIDRSGMAWCISAFGREAMTEIAIEEWAAASPVYTRRMQAALGYAPGTPGRGDVVTIFKGLQLDIGAPPQFMDFRFSVQDSCHGRFELAHCGALMDVEPMGEEFVRGMCHDIEDPTFDATAVASNPRAQVRPLHRPPRVPADRTPHCAWTVTIDDSFPEVEGIAALSVNEASAAATIELAAIDPDQEGLHDYSGPLLSDLDFGAFSHSALCRIADEVCLQMHLLDRGFTMAVAARAAGPEQVEEIRRRQLTGIAGLGAERLAATLDLAATAADDPRRAALRLLGLHPVLNPSAYVTVVAEEDALVVVDSPAHADGAWISLCGPSWKAALSAVVRALDPRLDVEVGPAGGFGPGAWRVEVVQTDEPAPEAAEVVLTRFSTGAAFRFAPRRSVPVVVGPA